VHPIKLQKDTAEDSELEGGSSSATLEANAGNAKCTSKPSSCPDLPSNEVKELDSPSKKTVYTYEPPIQIILLNMFLVKPLLPVLAK